MLQILNIAVTKFQNHILLNGILFSVTIANTTFGKKKLSVEAVENFKMVIANKY